LPAADVQSRHTASGRRGNLGSFKPSIIGGSHASFCNRLVRSRTGLQPYFHRLRRRFAGPGARAAGAGARYRRVQLDRRLYGHQRGIRWGKDDVTWTTNGVGIAPAIATAATGSISPSGFTAGGQVGWNYQINQYVFGIEADMAYTDLKATRTSVPIGFVNAMLSTVESRWLATVRGRLGFASGQALFYATGGLAIAEVKFFDQLWHRDSPDQFRQRHQFGWTVGGGVEWAFSQYWSIKAEYLYVDLGGASHNNLCSAALVCTTGLTLDHDMREHVARIGINYRFPGTLFATRY
jgi:outer membrane immunogenic protein